MVSAGANAQLSSALYAGADEIVNLASLQTFSETAVSPSIRSRQRLKTLRPTGSQELRSLPNDSRDLT